MSALDGTASPDPRPHDRRPPRSPDPGSRPGGRAVRVDRRLASRGLARARSRRAGPRPLSERSGPRAGHPRRPGRTLAHPGRSGARLWSRGQRRPDVDRIRSARSLMNALSISYGPGDPGAGSDGARSVGAPTCSVRRRGSHTGSSRCGGRRRSCHRSRGRRRNCRNDNRARRRSGQRNSLPQPASQIPLSTHHWARRAGRGGCRWDA